jgi:serine/threonine protein kinase
MIMEYAAGGSLYSILSSAEERAKLSPRSRLYIAEALVAALEYLHNNNIFHRDVKPENMCFWDDWENNPKMVLIDFGIASRVAERASGSVLTSHPGTIPYMAEEYLLRSLQFTEKGEVFSVGVVLLNLLTGDCSLTCLNHRETSSDEILSHLDTSAGVWLAGTDRELASLSCRCLAKDPDKRPTISGLLRKVKELRALICSDAFLEPRVTKRINSYNGRSRPPRTSIQTGLVRCVVCGIERLEGVLCMKHHLTCSSGSCLEEMVREQLGSKKFKCPASACTKYFQPIDFYGKISADLYGEALFAMDRVEEKAESMADLKESILRAIKDVNSQIDKAEQSIKDEINGSAAVDVICTSVSVVRDSTLDFELLQANIKSLLAMADESNRKQLRLERAFRRLLERQTQGDADTEARQQVILEQIENAKLCNAGGLSMMASGRLQCPRLCLLCPVRSHRGVRSRFTVANEYQLFFLCAHDKSPVSSSVKLKAPKKWLKKAAPFVKFALFSIRVLATVSGGIPLPSLPDCIQGTTMSERMDQVLQEMEILLEPDDIQSLEEWVDGVSDQRAWIDTIASHEREISEAAYGALIEEAYKPENRGWMREMDIGCSGDNAFAWVKKENLDAWKSSPYGPSIDPRHSFDITSKNTFAPTVHHLGQLAL